MRLNRSRINKIEQQVKMTVAEREARAEIQKQQELRYAEEWKRYQAYLTREEFDSWKRNEEKYLGQASESGRNQWPESNVTEKELDAARNRLLSTYSPEALERYKERHIAFEAVYKPRFIEWALMWMEEDPRWGGLDEVKLMGELQEEVTKELGFDSNGLSYPPDPEESLFDDDDDWERQNDIELTDEETENSTYEEDPELTQARAFAVDGYCEGGEY
ncbi:MAG: hypothetical protein N0E44_15785 [Candidatus Thiodiazotropha lotti]|nr:hypothetical protein [Candidatus Thiodiazotropha lotti]MCW4221345.1 hypothetical protein [Candidatus Thiodiazotropha lotti]